MGYKPIAYWKLNKMTMELRGKRLTHQLNLVFKAIEAYDNGITSPILDNTASYLET